ncbi:unnamed protein product [Trichobilharzia regenti]|nr:unnamed protein product [Trichobilharzia regenti]
MNLKPILLDKLNHWRHLFMKRVKELKILKDN